MLNENEIAQAIKLLSDNGFRSVARVTGEYIEKLVAQQLDAALADNCQTGFDAISNDYGKIEIKSRNADSKNYQCTLNENKLREMDAFILVIVKDGYVIHALLFHKKNLLTQFKRTKSRAITITRNRFSSGEDITDKISPPKSRSNEHKKFLQLKQKEYGL